MSNAFLIHWSSDRVRAAQAGARANETIPFLFGGPHISEPSLSRYHIAPDDIIYPVGVSKGRVSVLCEAVIEQLLSLEDFLAQQGAPRARLTATHDLHAWLQERGYAWLAPTCTDEAALLRSCTPLRFERFIPDDQLASLQFVNSRAKTRPINHFENGRLKTSTGLSGHYLRLAEESAALFSHIAHDVAAPSPLFP
jgi:hypothetical protein